jgi:hypothetical protein
MVQQQRFVEDVGMRDLPFPMRVASRIHPEGQVALRKTAGQDTVLRGNQGATSETGCGPKRKLRKEETKK